jgi:hypothetical protein
VVTLTTNSWRKLVVSSRIGDASGWYQRNRPSRLLSIHEGVHSEMMYTLAPYWVSLLGLGSLFVVGLD